MCGFVSQIKTEAVCLLFAAHGNTESPTHVAGSWRVSTGVEHRTAHGTPLSQASVSNIKADLNISTPVHCNGTFREIHEKNSSTHDISSRCVTRSRIVNLLRKKIAQFPYVSRDVIDLVERASPAPPI